MARFMSAMPKPPPYTRALLARLRGRVLYRTCSRSQEAKKGGGFLYSIHPGGRPAAPYSCLMLIRAGILVPQDDGVPDLTTTQTFILRDGL